MCSPFQPSTTNCRQRPGKHSSRSQPSPSTHPSPRIESFLPLRLSCRQRPRTHCQCHTTKTGTHCACVFNTRYTHKYTGKSFHKFTTAQRHTAFPGPGTTHHAKSAAAPPQTQNKTKAITVSCCYGSLGVRLKKKEVQEAQ